MLYMTASIREFLLRFSRKDVGRIFRLIIKISQIDQKIANTSYYYIYLIFPIHILSEGRRQKKYELSAYELNDSTLLRRTSAG